MAGVIDLYSLNGRVRKLTREQLAESIESTPAMNAARELLSNQVLPERSELVRLGNSYAAQMPAANAWTLLITIPTTLANLSLQNGEQIGGKTYIVDRFWLKNVTSEASAGELTPLSQLVIPGTALVANDATILRTNLCGTNGNSKAQLVMASVVTGCLLDKWNHHASKSQPETTNIASVVEVLCYGRYLVRPQGSFNINAQESVSGGTAICGIEWHEVQLDLP